MLRCGPYRLGEEELTPLVLSTLEWQITFLAM
ncbi:Uncharacterised protein [Corynebacterium amycolatum]|nr:Uncharacterised protein [Corynebacterium amycolatum]